jgi:hypothetical protein
MNIGFHSNQLSYRGTEVALFDYAFFNEKILNNKSVIISDKTHPHLERKSDFESAFATELYNDFSEVEKMVDKHQLDAIFYIKHGANDGKIVKNAKNWVQAVFRVNDPHGDAYFYNSPWMGDYMGNKPFVPHIVKKLPETDQNYREVFHIPADALVFGYLGGRDSFNIGFVQKVVEQVAQQENNIYFLFMNIDRFAHGPKVIHVRATSDEFEKSAFINTCDAMIYARECGETFGLSVGEFSVKNKPCVVYSESPERNHISTLRAGGIYYKNSDDLYTILTNFDKFYDKSKNYDFYSDFYSPINVMTHIDNYLIKGQNV